MNATPNSLNALHCQSAVQASPTPVRGGQGLHYTASDGRRVLDALQAFGAAMRGIGQLAGRS